MTDSSKGRSWKEDPGITIDDGSFIVSCGNCPGRSDLGNAECFNCISSRMLPGYKGAVVLKGEIDRKFKGPITDLLLEHSEILRTIRSSGEPRPDTGLMGRILIKRLSRSFERQFLDDPGMIVDHGKKMVEGNLLFRTPKRNKELLSSMIERTGVLLKKQERERSKHR